MHLILFRCQAISPFFFKLYLAQHSSLSKLLNIPNTNNVADERKPDSYQMLKEVTSLNL